ncbi:hypothetical protein [Methanolobus sp.]|uniref:hypothetical protein n=1 Tax=Methanolobus sp. TaxID=1874737 RepID=UPI00273204A0|nr:hypothetical protein [Methanolobus sp.]
MNLKRVVDLENILVVLIGIIIVLAMQYTEVLQSANAVFAGILAMITVKYTEITRKILEDNTKSRKISFITKQLEELYYPLLDFLKEYREVLYAAKWGKVQENSNNNPRKLQYLGDRDNSHDGCVIITDLIRKKYLFKEKETKVFFTIFVEGGHCTNHISSDVSFRTYDELKRLVEEDIHALEVKLRALTA